MSTPKKIQIFKCINTKKHFYTIDKPQKKNYKIINMAERLAIVDGHEYKVVPNEGTVLQLGKRAFCGIELEREETKDGKTEKVIISRSGELKLVGGEIINAGCGTEILATKDGKGIIECCGKPLVSQKPKPLPSSD